MRYHRYIYYHQTCQSDRFNNYRIFKDDDRMKNNTCLGCRTYFEEGEKVPLQSMFIEFKNYFLPLKQSKQKWILLKTMTGFLNSKGGTIYIGVEDKQGVVMGLPLSRKEQADFTTFLQEFINKIRPVVDMAKQEIKIVYVPVVSSKLFKGKYVIKIIVQQGDPAKTYHFAQRIQLQSRSKAEYFEVYHAFYRHNMGGIVEIRGEALLQQIARKASSPNEVSSTFHKFCNPNPLRLDEPLTKIGFAGIRQQQLRKKFTEIFFQTNNGLEIDCELTYDIENQVLLIELESQDRFRQINRYVKEKLGEFTLAGFSFIEKGECLDFYLYKNVAGVREVSSGIGRDVPTSPRVVRRQSFSQVKGQKKEEEKRVEKEQQTVVEASKKTEEPIKVDNSIKKEEKGETGKELRELAPKPFCKQFILTVTNINADKSAALEKQLRELIADKYKVELDRYAHTFELSFSRREEVLDFNEHFQKQGKRWGEFGVNNNLMSGINTRQLRITNYDRTKKKSLKAYIEEKMGKEAEEIEFKKSNNKYFLECRFKSREGCCQWLDRLLADGKIPGEFSIPGSENGKAAKLRIYLNCLLS